MRILIAPAAFKGTLSAAAAARAMSAGARRACPSAEIVTLPLADGGAGTVDALVRAAGGWTEACTVTGPLGSPVRAHIGWLVRSGVPPADVLGLPTAVVEIAGAAGLAIVPPEHRNPLHTTTYGVGELIARILSRADGGRAEHRRHERAEDRAPAHAGGRIQIGLGDSATVDLAAGIAQALGARFFDGSGEVLPAPIRGGDLCEVTRIDLGGLRPDLRDWSLEALCDVDNPLLGSEGAAAVFAPQKGASPEAVARLEAALTRTAALLEAACGRSIRDLPGAGAAGGAGGGLAGFLDARLLHGAEAVLDACRFDAHLWSADLVLTGEGRIDAQTLRGKTVVAAAQRASAAGVAVLAVSGAIELAPEALRRVGILSTRVLGTPAGLPSRDEQHLASETDALVRGWIHGRRTPAAGL